MRVQTIYCTAIAACALLFASTLMFGCTETNLVAPERKSEAEFDDATLINKKGVQKQTADVFEQGSDDDVRVENGATLRRTPDGISAQLRMPTPQPGTYTYPSGPEGGAWTDEEGPPEAFTLWVFVFDDPEDEDWTGAFLGGGHVVGGPHLTLSGYISTNTEPFLGSYLENPQDARVHLAVAPHGALDPALMPDQIQTPTQIFIPG